MKAIYRLVVMMVAIVALLALSATVYASKDSRIESTAKKSYVFQTYFRVMISKSSPGMAP